MGTEHRGPTPATIKFLYANAYRCAFNQCTRPLYRVDEQTGVRTLNSRVCHINARSEEGPRWDATQSEDDNRSEANLLLLCVEHSNSIDNLKTASYYSPELLGTWKSKQLEDFDRIQQGWHLDDAMLEEVQKLSFKGVDIAINDSPIDLGGKGGSAPSAGGGGGGAIGHGAKGGRGGNGGSHWIDEGEFTLPWTDRAEALKAAEKQAADGSAGAGGGGGSAVGDSAIGGSGGGGGEHVSANIDIVKLRAAGLESVQVIVGASGEESAMNFLTKDRAVSKSLRAAPGSPGSYDFDEISADEIVNGDFRITSFMPANYAEHNGGLFYVTGGAWGHFSVAQVPVDVIWYIACSAQWVRLSDSSRRGVFCTVSEGSGKEILRVGLTIEPEVIKSNAAMWAVSLAISVVDLGDYKLEIESSCITLASYRLPVRLLE